MARAGMTRCTNCGLIHYINRSPAIYIGGSYYCKASCANAHRQKEPANAEPDDTAGDAVRHFIGKHG